MTDLKSNNPAKACIENNVRYTTDIRITENGLFSRAHIDIRGIDLASKEEIEKLKSWLDDLHSKLEALKCNEPS